MTETRIFLSYARSDEDWARELAQALRALGANVWFDQWSIQAGDNLAQAIEQGLREADFIVFVISPESIHRPNLFFELGAAVGMGKRLAAVVPENIVLSELPVPLLTRKYVAKRSPQETAKELVGQLGDVPSGSQEELT